MQITSPPQLVLGSTSPRRKQLLGLGLLPFNVEAADIDETETAGEQPRDYVGRLALQKARKVAERAEAGVLVLGSDTTVALDGAILAKPVDEADAKRMLIDLRNRKHQVYTAVAVVVAGTSTEYMEVVETEVPMRDYSDEEIDAYIATGDPMDKAGAYGIQNASFRPVIGMRQCYASVMGFPICAVQKLLTKTGKALKAGVEERCQDLLDYQCTVFSIYLAG